MITDLHSHTYHSFCGKDNPHDTCNAAIEGGIELFGICDHNYGVMREIKQEEIDAYYGELCELQKEYEGKLRIVKGIELRTVTDKTLPDFADVSFFDYALIEHIDRPDSILAPIDGKSGIFDYAKRVGTRCGIAHTDLFTFAKNNAIDIKSFLKELAENDIFWEMNVNYDSTHKYQEHQYVKDFVNSPEQQQIVKESGIALSVGFDGHKVEDYCPEKVINMCRFIEENGFRQMVF